MTTQEYIWNYFLNKNFSPYGIAGIMGNIQKESRFLTNNVDDKAPYTDVQYTSMVDNGTYNNFINDNYGYGLVQWTYDPFKQDLLNLCKLRHKSIGDLSCQVDQLYNHIKSEKLLTTLQNATSIEDATIYFMTKFEKPTDQSQKAKDERIKYAKEIYQQFNKGKGGNGMKYSNSNPPLVCMQTTSTCYQQTSKMTIKGILWHSTGANNTTLKRYVQPSDNDPNRNTLLAKIGTNTGRNDWNHISVQAGLNAWVGTLADGSVAAVQTMPWDYRPWGCGSGSRGSCNNGWIQFEICEDGLTNKDYFDKVYKEACELTAYLCKKYNLNPKGSTQFNGISVPIILCHQDSAQLGLGSNHADIYHWFTKFGKNMNTVREDVSKLSGSNSSISAQINTSYIPTSQTKRELGLGDEGEDVKLLQQKLIKLGYNLGQWKDDGDFGELTEKAILDIQNKYHLDADGIVGDNTMAIIDKLLSTKNTNNNQQSNNNVENTNEIYRLRRSWDDAVSQIGAYRQLNNAIKACNSYNGIYKVFNSKGEVVYSVNNNNNNNTNLINTTSKTVIIGSSSKDENGQYRGGIAGDQTGKEVLVMNWYDGGWKYVIRPKSNTLANKIASCCKDACNNNNIGYDQNQRNTLYLEAKKVNLNLLNINVPCECDCTSLVSTCCICAGLPENIFYAGGNMRITSNLVKACEQTNEFNILTSTNYTKSSDYLQAGDILLSDGHAVIVLSNGPKANQIATTVTKVETYKVRVMVNTLNVRSGPTSSNAIVTQIKKNGVYTIIEEKEGWGKLKSGAGWIDLQYTQRL